METIIDIVNIYVDCSGKEMLPDVHQRCNDILAAEDNSDKVQNFVNVLEETYSIMIQHIMSNMLYYLQPILNSK